MVAGMVVKLTTKDIGENWSLIKQALAEAPPLAGELDGKYHRMLSALMCGAYECWFVFDEEDKLKYCIITGFLNDDLSGNKNLLIYLCYSYDKLTKRDKASGIIAMKHYAISQGCTQIVGYSNLDYIINLAEASGGSADYRFFAIPI